MNPSHTTRFRPAKRGFALIVTLSLMILLTVIAVGLLTLSSISLRSSSQGEAGAAARANARLALMMAIGELQKELGPDSRISAPPDAGTIATGGQPHWTAVYDAWARPTDPSVPETPASRVPKFRSWLASGANSATGGPPGIIDPKTGKPATETLVGQGSLASTAAPLDQINVPMHGLAVGKNQGRIAWWVSDESSKAKINAGAGAELATKPLFDAQSPPNIGHQAIPELKTFEWGPGQRAISISNGSVNLAAGLGSRGIGNLNHDITVHSAGVLSDVRAGRLKRDLSNLLSRPVTELENKPLYLADGRMNRFQITEEGAVSNAASIAANATGAGRWGINLEELHLFHQLHREVDWGSGKPRLVNKNSKEDLANDRFYIYRQPVIEAMQAVLSFKAIPDTAPGTFKIQSMLDAMIAVSNPNDIPTVWPSSLILKMEMHSFPYLVDWDIRGKNNPNGTPGPLKVTHKTGTMNAPFFKANIKNGFTLEPGEAAVFGSSLADTQARQSNLTRGFAARGGVAIGDGDWGGGSNIGLRAGGLASDDVIDFAMIKATGFSLGDAPSGWYLCPKSVSNSSGSNLSLGSLALGGGGKTLLYSPLLDKYMLPKINPPQRLAVSEFTGKPMPVMMITLVPNVEKSRTSILPPNAFASRPFHLREPAVARSSFSTQTSAAQPSQEQGMHTSQLLIMAEPMDYEFGNDRTLAAGVGGQNLYHGGAREVGLGGKISVVKRRIPVAPPLSIGAFENAIACGLLTRFAPGSALSGNGQGLPSIAKAIGNSWSTPFLAASSVFADNYHDPSWMANTALWDSWFLSGIVDASATSSSWDADTRSPRDQFRELAEGTGKLRNQRLAYNPRTSVKEAMDELFNGNAFKPSAINKLPKYLLVDGAFNVNSTSEAAWRALLSSVQDQELFVAGGAKQKFGHPFGTLGYAQDPSPTNDWSGLRDLSASEIDKLAKAIVVEVKARGPFLSMADFVNRRPNSSDLGQQALGALQLAIDKSGLNDRYKDAERKLLPADIPALAGKDTLNDEPVPTRSIGSAGFLSQAAVLSSLGSQITVRGDTFVIRTYGDARDASGKITAKAWCEAVVQRLPDYVDASNAPEVSDNLTITNSTFGRKFDIISFRWLNSVEI